MRAAACLVALLAFAGAALADQARNVPAPGSKLTYRTMIETVLGGKKHVSGMVYTYIVTASDATTAEGIIKPVAQIIHCDGGTADPVCRGVPNSHIEGDLLTQSIGDAAGNALAKHSHFKLAYFLPQERKFPMPASRDPNHAFGEVGPEPNFVMTNTLNCDPAALAGFAPVGTAPHVAFDCEFGFESTASRSQSVPARSSHDAVTYDFTYAGDGWVTLPSGNWAVKKLAFKMTPKDPSHPGSEGESLFSPQLGAVVKTRSVGNNAANGATTETTAELISVEP